MPFFPSHIETHANLMSRMRSHAFRPASPAIAFVAPWEAQERVKPTEAHLVALEADAAKNLDENVPEEKELASNIVEFRTDHFSKLAKNIADGNFDCNGPAVFYDIDLAATIVEKLAEEYVRLGKPLTPVAVERVRPADYKPLPTFKDTIKKIEWKKWVLGGGLAYGAYWFLTRRTSEAILPLKTERENEKAAEIEQKKMKVGPTVKAETWQVTEDDKNLLRRLIERVTGT